MCLTKSSENEIKHFSVIVFYHFQYLRVEVDDQGNLVQIDNLNKSIAVTFTNQGFYLYEGMSITNIKNFIFFQLEAFLVIILRQNFKHQVLMCSDHLHKFHSQ
jgi:hypothetical protein